MKSSAARCIFTLVSALAAVTYQRALAGESAALLKGAETYNLKVKIYTENGCEADHSRLASKSTQSFSRAPRLRWVAEEAIPDIMLSITVDVTALPPGSKETEMCMYLVNARSIHPMLGKFRYADQPRVVQTLTFNKTLYSVIVPGKVQEAIELQTQKVLDMFLDEYLLGNPYP